MTVGTLWDYFDTRLPLRLEPRQHFRLLGVVFLLVFSSAALIHLLIRPDTSPTGVLIHASAIGLVYVVAVWLAAALLFAARDAARNLRVWQVWVVSLAAFLLGYYLLPVDALLGRLARGADTRHDPIGIVPLLSVWCLVTYLFIQPYLQQGLKAELARLRDLNDLLARRRETRDRPPRELVRFEAGRTEFTLPAAAIRNIAVEDHYCYIHYRADEGYGKRDLAMPLRDLMAILPAGFVRVHRSHVVNLEQVTAIRREGRNLRLVLQGGYEVPISRHRLDRVLPLLRQRVSSRHTGRGA